MSPDYPLKGDFPSCEIQTKVEFIGVLRHMQRYLSHIYDGTGVRIEEEVVTTVGLPTP